MILATVPLVIDYSSPFCSRGQPQVSLGELLHRLFLKWLIEICYRSCA